jgi:GTP-binding protein
MIIRSADFIKSSTKLDQCPDDGYPEFAFIGRSNVGKSTLINMLTGHPGLAKISSTPGKTRTINHFLINKEWYIADLPGYGYAKTSASLREDWSKATKNYILKRETLVCLFMLIDSRIKPQKSDLDFMEMLGLNQVPFARIFTKADKIKSREVNKTISEHNALMLGTWEELPAWFVTSSVKKKGRDELLEFIEQTINNWKNDK